MKLRAFSRMPQCVRLSEWLDGAATAADDRPPHTFLAATPLWRLRFSPKRVPPVNATEQARFETHFAPQLNALKL